MRRFISHCHRAIRLKGLGNHRAVNSKKSRTHEINGIQQSRFQVNLVQKISRVLNLQPHKTLVMGEVKETGSWNPVQFYNKKKVHKYSQIQVQ